MLKKLIKFPENIRYFSQWKEFSLPNYPIILDKRLPGCGFTDYCITNNQDLVLCSPRRILLQNKTEQHSNDVFCIVNNSNKFDFAKLSKDLMSYINFRHSSNLPAKILVTYDSFHTIKNILEFNLIIQDFQIIIDEFQSLFSDSNFKAVTEMNFISSLSDLKKVCYVSATPMMEKYLDQLNEFSSLPLYEIDWSNLTNYNKPKLTVRISSNLCGVAKRIIDSYLSGKFERQFVGSNLIESKEAVFYVNSVTNICNIIKKCNLNYQDCNILCAVTDYNISKIANKLGKDFTIGRVPLKGEPHKMFTFCTRTVYLGADFYSTNARSFIFSDANVKVLAIDISLDLPQILGRQRLDENPWKNEAEFYYKPKSKNDTTLSEFKDKINQKLQRSNHIIGIFNSCPKEYLDSLLSIFYTYIKEHGYENDYISLDLKKNAATLKQEAKPVINKLVMISEQRAFDMQQVDYANRLSILENVKKVAEVDNSVNEFLSKFESITGFYAKLKYLCEFGKTADRYLIMEILNQISDPRFKTYYLSLGPDRLRELGYNITLIQKDLDVKCFDTDILKQEVTKVFEVGKKYHSKFIKEELGKIYSNIGYKKNPISTDILQWYNVKMGMYVIGGHKQRGYKLISLK
jgi:hypothetical protein